MIPPWYSPASMPAAVPDSTPELSTLPDLLIPGLDVVFVGINPSLYSVERRHYFARRTNRFWPAYSRSVLSATARQGLAVDTLGPEHDGDLLRFGTGFTDIVKIPSRNAAQVPPESFVEGAVALLARLEQAAPRVACFHGITALRPFFRHALGMADAQPALGPQPQILTMTRLFLVPNPSPANAHFTVDDQAAWYDRLAAFIAELGTV